MSSPPRTPLSGGAYLRCPGNPTPNVQGPGQIVRGAPNGQTITIAGLRSILPEPRLDEEKLAGLQLQQDAAYAAFGHRALFCQGVLARPTDTLIIGNIGEGHEHELRRRRQLGCPGPGHDPNAHAGPLAVERA